MPGHIFQLQVNPSCMRMHLLQLPLIQVTQHYSAHQPKSPTHAGYKARQQEYYLQTVQ